MHRILIAIMVMACRSSDPIAQTPEHAGSSARSIAAVDLSLQDKYGCLRDPAGSVRCWGQNDSGEVGDGTSTPNVPSANVRHEPTLVKGAVAAGALHTSMDLSWVVHDDGTVTAWGEFQHSVGSDVETWSKLVPTRWELPAVREIAVGYGFVCVIARDNTVWCEGNGSNGELADHPDTDGKVSGHLALAPATLIGHADQIVAVENDACARIGDKVTCWGESWGVDQGSIDEPPVPPAISSAPHAAPPHPEIGHRHRIDRTPVRLAITNVERLIAGDKQICALDKDGVAWCWSAESNSLPTNPTPTKLAMCKGPLSQLALGSEQCAEQRDGTVCCVDLYGPIDTSRLRGADHLGIGGFLVCGLVDHELRCAGRGHADETSLFASP
jgi:alpha-tubulin suppressor-like RCC1 family protein